MKLEERIEAYIKVYQKLPHGHEVEGTVELLEECKNAIRMCTACPHHWIPVKERLPDKEGKTYLVTYQTPSGRRRVKEAFCNSVCETPRVAYWTKRINGNVIAWMPMPEPYRPKKESDKHGTQS